MESREAGAPAGPAAEKPRQTFPRSLRITLKREFDAVRAGGKSVRDGVLRIGWLCRDQGPTRLGLAVSVRAGGAVRRNRIKRVVRDVFRRHRLVFPEGLDLVVIPIDPKAASDVPSVEASFRRLSARIARDLRPGDGKAAP